MSIRTKILDQGQDTLVADTIMAIAEEDGFSPEEIIPGLIMAVILLAEKTFDPETALDEAANLLADGPSARERW